MENVIERRKKLKTFTVNIDEKLDHTLDDLKEKLQKSSKSEIFRLSIALLKIVAEAKVKGAKFIIIDENSEREKEILIP